jgi:hypothetical protein
MNLTGPTKWSLALLAASCIGLLQAGPVHAAGPGMASRETAGIDDSGASMSKPATNLVPWTIRSSASDLCLQPLNESFDRGVAIIQEPCNAGPAQQWEEIPISGAIFHYRNVLTGLCLDARGGATNGTPVQQWVCNNISNENWEVTEDQPDSGVELISRVSGTRSHCLDVPNSQQTIGLAMQIYGCNGTRAQNWFD